MSEKKVGMGYPIGMFSGAVVGVSAGAIVGGFGIPIGATSGAIAGGEIGKKVENGIKKLKEQIKKQSKGWN